MKKTLVIIILLAFWIAACTAIPSPTLPSDAVDAPSLTASIMSTPSIAPSPSATSSPPTSTSMPPSQIATPVLASTLIIPTLQAGSPAKLLSIQMIDAKTGWGIQEGSYELLRPDSRLHLFYTWRPEGYILRTSDGGKSWQNVTPPTGAYSPGGLFALDVNSAWASDNLPGSITPLATRVWRTTDGGQTWQASQPFWVADWSEFYLPTRMQFIDRNVGWLLAATEVGMDGYILREVLFRTIDGGNTWERINSFLEDLCVCGNGGLAFRDATTGWYGFSCVGGGKLIMPFNTLFAEGGLQVRQTVDGGETFSAYTIIPMPPDLQRLAAANPEMDCGENRMIAFTPEVMGIEWECIDYADRTRYRYFSLSTSAGHTWNTWEPAGNEYFLNAAHGWRLLSPGQFQQTTDGGLNWVTLKTVSWQNAQFDFTSEQEGWALVSNDNITALVHTTDGGKTWEEIKPVIAFQ